MATRTKNLSLDNLCNYFILPTQSLQDVEKNLDDINAELRVLDTASRKTHFAFENTQEQIQTERDRLQELKQTVEKEKTRLQMASKGYREELDLTPLGWINKDSLLPALFIINIRDSSVSLRVIHRKGLVISFNYVGERIAWHGPTEKQYPEAICLLYEEAAKNIAYKCDSLWDRQTTATAKFQGIIPEKTRQKIEQAIKSRLFDDIYIITEAKNWSVENVLIVRDDPYVVGWVGKTSQMFIIDFFDPTPLEVYIKEQHTF